VPIGDLWPMVPVNSVVSDIRELNDIPIRSQGPQTVFLRDIGSVEDAADIQTGYALVDGHRTVYIPVTKRADASTLAVVGLVRENLPRFQAVLPDDIVVSYQFDQSSYVTRAISGLLFEAGLGAVLTGVMVLLFLRDWRSALIVVLNIPLAIVSATLALWVSGQTVNIMTLGGLALAVGILVDESTVTIENIHTHLARGRSFARAARDATLETTVPRFLAMLCILAVFIPAFFMTGAARNLFVPLSLAVGFSMVGSYLLSSTLVPVLSVWLLRAEPRHGQPRESAFGQLRRRYARVASCVIARGRVVVSSYLVISALLIAIVGGALGTEIFPAVDTGQFQLRLRALPGTRIERTEQIALQVLEAIKGEVGPDNVEISLGFIGTQPPNYPINAIYLWSSGSEEATLQIQLKRKAGFRVEELKQTLRKKLPEELRDVRFSFEPSDIVSRVMSFGAPTPIEVAVSGTNITDIRHYAEKLQKNLAQETMLRDLGFEQELDYPIIKVDLNRELAGVLGLTARNIGQSLIPATSSSRYTAVNYWADPKSGVGYQVQVQIPGHRINSLEEVRILPIARRDGRQVALRDLATISKESTLGEYDRYNMQRMLTLSANIAGDDLGGAAKRVRQAIRSTGKPPEKVSVTVRGQVQPMEEMFGGLQWGLLVAIGTILLLLTAYFQSFRLSIAVTLTIPAVIAGVGVMLWLTHTTLNIQSFMGAIMAVGVAVANSILLVTFAERSRLEGREPSTAAIEGASSRLRPILMTSAAMIAGMIPMALGLGEGGEQTAPLGRAVIGGLSGATCATLLVLPAIFTMLAWRSGRTSASLDPEDAQSPHFEARDVHTTHDNRGNEPVDRDMLAALGPDDPQGRHLEVGDVHATDDGRDREEVERDTPTASGPEDPQSRHFEAGDVEDQQSAPVEAHDVHATDDRGSEQIEGDTPSLPSPEDQQSAPVEARDSRVTDDRRASEQVERETPAALRPEDQQSPHFEASDSRVTDDDRGGEQVERETPVELGSEDQQSAPAEARDVHAADDRGSEQMEIDTPSPPSPEYPQSPPVETHDPRATDDRHDSDEQDRNETE
jgi:multidrug efflux pump subunit AcrB